MIPNTPPPLDFGLGETADAIRETTARFAADRIAPLAAEIDATNHFPARALARDGRARPARHHRGGGVRRPRPRLPRARAWRWRRSPAPRPPSASATAPTPTSASTRSAAGARDEQKRRYLPKLISGEHVGALAMSEAGAGSDVISHEAAGREAGRPLRAERHQVLDHQRARTPTPWWSTPRPTPEAGSRGVTAFLIEKGFKGFQRLPEARQDGHARLRHRRAGVRGLRGPGRERAWAR